MQSLFACLIMTLCSFFSWSSMASVPAQLTAQKNLTITEQGLNIKRAYFGQMDSCKLKALSYKADKTITQGQILFVLAQSADQTKMILTLESEDYQSYQLICQRNNGYSMRALPVNALSRTLETFFQAQ